MSYLPFKPKPLGQATTFVKKRGRNGRQRFGPPASTVQENSPPIAPVPTYFGNDKEKQGREPTKQLAHRASSAVVQRLHTLRPLDIEEC